MKENTPMKLLPIVLAVWCASLATDAKAQVDLTGRYRCVQGCLDGGVQPAFVTQNGRDLNMVNEVGQPSRAWIDFIGHIWAENWNQGAIYSPDGLVIQFDRGTVWQREPEVLLVPPPPPRSRRQARREAAPPPPPAPRAEHPAVALNNAFDGPWSVVISTANGGCDPQYRFGVQITNGTISYEGGGAGDAQGRVAPSGAVWVHVAAAGNHATGEGRLARDAGNGTWRGQGPGGTCTGTWQAARRG
jgi:hypothetical protein